jgi:dephospho-CoA kinase
VIVLGLTGSIGMGKSTTAGLFRQAGIPVYDADAEVAALYAPGGAAAAAVEQAFPGVTNNGAVDRALLSAALLTEQGGLKRLEAVVHPLVRLRRAAFLDAARDAGAKAVVLDIPLLFEVGAENQVDAVVVVSAPTDVQRQRALSRPGMSAEKLALILARQVPDAEKRGRADFVIDTSAGLDDARIQVGHVLGVVTAPGWVPPRLRDA